MNRSERQKLIEDIAHILKLKKNIIIENSLENFGFDTSGIGLLGVTDKEEYIIKKLKGGNDGDIIDLAKHLEIINSKEEKIENPKFWEAGYFRLFISHLATNKKHANSLKEALSKYGISCFVAHEDITPSALWQTEIELALQTCDGLVALLEPGFQESAWTDQEIGFAFGREVLIIPVKNGLDPYGFIGKFQAISTLDFENQINQIYKIILNNHKSKLKMTEALMTKFENSESYIDARNNIRLIEMINNWDDGLINRLKIALKNNSQINDATGVEGKIKIILNRYNKN